MQLWRLMPNLGARLELVQRKIPVILRTWWSCCLHQLLFSSELLLLCCTTSTDLTSYISILSQDLQLFIYSCISFQNTFIFVFRVSIEVFNHPKTRVALSYWYYTFLGCCNSACMQIYCKRCHKCASLLWVSRKGLKLRSEDLWGWSLVHSFPI